MTELANSKFLSKIEQDSFIVGFDLGLEAAQTMDKNLTAVGIEYAYGIHKTTAQSWLNYDLSDIEKREKRIIVEFLRRHNFKNTKEYMEKYKLSSNNTKGVISQNFVMNIRTVDKYQNSQIKWKTELINYLLSVNKELFERQVAFAKKCIKSNQDQIE